jgi:hypothetical protein
LNLVFEVSAIAIARVGLSIWAKVMSGSEILFLRSELLESCGLVVLHDIEGKLDL